jgi:hypothetical protein
MTLLLKSLKPTLTWCYSANKETSIVSANCIGVIVRECGQPYTNFVVVRLSMI